MRARGSFHDLLAANLVRVVSVGLLVMAADLFGWYEQAPIQRGIDAHTVTLGGTYERVVRGDDALLQNDTYVVGYTYEARSIEATLRGLPGNPAIGDGLCLEIDGERPEHARVCGTRGDLGDARHDIVGIGTVLAVVLLILSVAAWRHARREEGAPVAEAMAGYGGRAPPPDYRGVNLVLRTAPVVRWSKAALYAGGFALLAFGLVDTSIARGDGGPRTIRVVLVGLAVTALVAVRCLGESVRCSPETVIVRGIVLTRRIPTVRVTAVKLSSVDTLARIHWQTPSGRRRVWWLTPFPAGDRTVDGLFNHNVAQLTRLAAWLVANGVPARTWIEPAQARGPFR